MFGLIARLVGLFVPAPFTGLAAGALLFAAVAGSYGFVYVKGRADGYAVARAEDAAALRDAKKGSLKAQDEDADQAQRDAAEAAAFKKWIEGLPDDDARGVCFSDLESERLRSIFKR